MTNFELPAAAAQAINFGAGDFCEAMSALRGKVESLPNGDVLDRIAEAMERQADARELSALCAVGRLSGAEFGILLPQQRHVLVSLCDKIAARHTAPPQGGEGK